MQIRLRGYIVTLQSLSLLVAWGVFSVVAQQANFASAAGPDSGPIGGVEKQLKKQATWSWPELKQYELQIQSYMDQRQLPDRQQVDVRDAWTQPAPPSPGPETLDRIIRVIAMIEPRTKSLLDQIFDTTNPTSAPDLTWFDASVPGWAQDQLTLAAARYLAQRRWYDESLELLATLELSQVCDPASLMFYRATCMHNLFKKDDALKSISVLLERESELPNRYAIPAKLMAQDIEPMKADSLDEIARMMNDSGRRLDLGRAGTIVRTVQDEIIEKLDKQIKEMEEQAQQAQQQQQASNSQPQGAQQSTPMQDSQAAGQRGPGDVDPKKLGDRGNWGNLPPAERQEALQQITKDLPSHYREVIEEYFKRLATQNP